MSIVYTTNYKFTCECGQEIKHFGRDKHIAGEVHKNRLLKLNNKEEYEKDVIRMKTNKQINSKRYYLDNRDKISIYQNNYNLTKTTCECGTTLCRGAIYLHRYSKKHIKLMESLQPLKD